MALIRITRWFDGKTLHEVESEDLRAAVVKLVKGGANLGGANLRNSNIGGTSVKRHRGTRISATPTSVARTSRPMRRGNNISPKSCRHC